MASANDRAAASRLRVKTRLDRLEAIVLRLMNEHDMED